MARKAVWWKKRAGLNNAINKQMSSSRRTERRTEMSLEDRVACIHRADLKDLPDIVLAADEDRFIQYQWRIIPPHYSLPE